MAIAYVKNRTSFEQSKYQFGGYVDALFFFGIFSSMGLALKGYKKVATIVLVSILPFVAMWYISNINFKLNLSF